MRENILKAAFDAVYDEEFALSADELPEHSFSRRHNKAMKKLFHKAGHTWKAEQTGQAAQTGRAKDPAPTAPAKTRRPVRKRVIALAAVGFIAATAAVIMLCGAQSFNIVTKDFRGHILKFEWDENTYYEFFPKTIGNSPTVIEKTYYIPELPKSFEFEYSNQGEDQFNVSYNSFWLKDMQNEQYICLDQLTKAAANKYGLETFDYYETVDINGFEGIYTELTFEPKGAQRFGAFSCGVWWDNGEYILYLATKNIDKETTLEYARSVVEGNFEDAVFTKEDTVSMAPINPNPIIPNS